MSQDASGYEHLGEGCVVLRSGRIYLSKFRPYGRTDIAEGAVKEGVQLGVGPFEWKPSEFAHDSIVPAISIKLIDGSWTPPMAASMFVAETTEEGGEDETAHQSVGTDVADHEYLAHRR